MSAKRRKKRNFTPIKVEKPETIFLGLDQIVRGENLVRGAGTDTGDLFALAASMKAIGQLTPIVVELRPDGKYDLRRGFRRYDAALIVRKRKPEFKLEAEVFSG